MLNFFRLDSLRRIRLSPTDSDVIEIECEMTGPAWAGEPVRSFWLPINEVAVVPLGDIVTAGDFHLSHEPRLRQRVKDFTTDNVREFLFSYSSKVETPNGGMLLPESPAKRPCFVQADGPKPVAVPAIELTRFYLAGMSVVVDHLMHFDVEPDAVFDRYCDLSRTGYLDEGRREFRVAPKPGLCDRGAALQIAMLMTDDVLRTSFANFVRRIRQSAAAGDDQAELPFFRSPAPLDLKFELADQDDGRIIKLKSHTLASRVLSDFRKPGFDRLVVELPVGYEQAEFNSPRLPPESERRPPIDPNAEIIRTVRSGTRSHKMGTAQGGLAQSFPFLNGVKTRYEKRTKLPPPAPRLPGLPPEPIKQASPLPGESKNRVAKLVIVQRSEADEEVRERPTNEAASFLDGIDDALLPKLVTIAARDLDDRMGRFLSAGAMLVRDGVLDVAASSLVSGVTGSARAFELVRACGSWAWSRKWKRGRRVLFLPIIIEHRTVWAISIERKSRQGISMGVLLARTPVGELDFVARTLAALAVRNSARLGKGGRTFPASDYADVRFAPLAHRPERTRVSELSRALLDRARTLAKRESDHADDAV